MSSLVSCNNISQWTHSHTCDCDRCLGSVYSDPAQARKVRYYRHMLDDILQDVVREPWVYRP